MFENGKCHYYPGNYDYYLEKRIVTEDNVIGIDDKMLSTHGGKVKYVSNFKERSKLERKVQKLENEIQKLEENIADCHKEMMKEEVYMSVEKSKKVKLKIQEYQELLDSRMYEWEEIMLELEKSIV